MKKFALVLFLALPLWAKTHELIFTGQQQVISCQNDDRVELVGDSNQIVLKGNCQQVQVTGTSNSIRLEGAVQSIQVVGSDNHFTWQGGQGRVAPKFEALGANNSLTSAR